jgi:serine protease
LEKTEASISFSSRATVDSRTALPHSLIHSGTHVSGIIAARKNGQGVVGQIPDDNICILTARVLDDHDYGYFSHIMEGIQWAVDMGARVINVSIVGGSYVPAVNAAFEAFYNSRNVLIFAAAGNDGSSNYAYPASYKTVISVAAVDERKQHPYFSQHNNMVDIAAPGQDVLSTLPTGVGNYIATLTAAGFEGFSGDWASRSPKTTVAGTIISCADGYTCRGPGNHICILPR